MKKIHFWISKNKEVIHGRVPCGVNWNRFGIKTYRLKSKVTCLRCLKAIAQNNFS